MTPLSLRPVLGLLGGLSGVCVIVHLLATPQTYYNFLIWNLFLAWLPFLFSTAALALNGRRRLGPAGLFALGILGVAWLLLLPNSPYVLTDLIHLTVRRELYTEAGRLVLTYWTDFLLIFTFAWTGIILGILSLYQFQYIIFTRTNMAVSWLFAALASLLSGYGILLGREYRLNSWDVLGKPSAVLDIVSDTLEPSSIIVCLFFGTVLLMMYATVHTLLGLAARDSRSWPY
ncbi:DUF1361 domain-containing protein [Paenibacillus mucilaginosus]|uniref:DUF1361 domain-containing protein n=1 Tax=Paenibacillus mucilaginosus (strain KNP414) TaxID=1036673 RepID=F8F5P1_PAEMK|nr:DUF1361 domain-containing protein [Paenibacillus mucilaginosus]AEI41214.1 protein of unknown function DUF1361 [Paenibacillus mucilaginosus KNP414]MCG7211363.1 DUF1361 domain-containing protein [Paenibacillus mucilaginosus]WDM30254.1 DUF1361 domain-containing protein [Paenibacillus mucilaginosus]